MAQTVIPAEKRIDGMYGEVWVGTSWWADITGVTGTIRSERKPINPAGTTQTYYKRGRTTREGSFTFDKVDSSREYDFLTRINRALSDRRANRSDPWFPKFNMMLKLDDPDAWGVEEIMLMNCETWTMPIGFSLAELKTVEMEFTWEYEDLGDHLARIRRPADPV